MMQNLGDKKKIEIQQGTAEKDKRTDHDVPHLEQVQFLNIFEDVYEKMVQIVGETLDVRSCGYYVPDGDKKELILYTGYTKDGSRRDGLAAHQYARRTERADPASAKASREG
jgi:hypothetical protein